MATPSTRREFLEHTSAAAIAAAALSPGHARADVSPNDKLAVALIGCGGRGQHDAGLFKDVPGVELKYVCDVDEGRRLSAAKSLGVDASRAMPDMRKVLDDKSLTAVIVATPDHWHSPAAILASEAAPRCRSTG